MYCKYLRKAKDYLSATTVPVCNVVFLMLKWKVIIPSRDSLICLRGGGSPLKFSEAYNYFGALGLNLR